MKRRIGDRKDGKLIRDLDGMHFIVPLLYPNRCDNEAYLYEKIDLTNLDKYLENVNKDRKEDDKINLFQFIVTVFLKITYARPKMNRFIANKNFYQRNEHTASFVIKKTFHDDGQEGLAFIHSIPGDNLFTIHSKIKEQIDKCRETNEVDDSTKSMDIFNKMPRFFSKFLVNIICKLDKHGKVPQSLINTDPYYSSVVLTHLGSIRLHSGYHHLTNWGTNSVFVAIGETKIRPFIDEDGNEILKNSVDIGLTIDERIADGFYYSKTIRLIKHLFENPQELELPFEQKENN